MADDLTVHVNADGIHSVSAEAASFETTGSFALVLQNHGSPAHVHVHLDESLARGASLDASNHYVDANARRVVRVAVRDEERPVSGELTVYTGYGSESVAIPVSVREPTETDEGVAVAEEFSKKPAQSGGTRAEGPGLAPALVGGASVVLAVVSFLALDGLVALFVGGVLLVGGLAAGVFLARQG